MAYDNVVKHLSAPVQPAIAVLVVASTVIVFVLDVLTPLGVAVWVLYLFPLALTMLARSPLLPVLVGAASAVAIVVTLLTDPPLVTGITPEVAWFNRGAAITTVGFLTVILRNAIADRVHLDAEDALSAAQARLLEAAQGVSSPAALGERLLTSLGDILGASVGVFYAGDDDALRRVAVRGIPADAAPEHLHPEQGLLAPSPRGAELAVAARVPAEHLVVRSALATVPAADLVVLPLAARGRTIGAVELALPRPAQPADRDLLRRVAEPLGISLRAALDHERVLVLLDETRRQAEIVASQQQELARRNSELEEHTAALSASQAQLEAQQAELEQSNTELQTQAEALEQHAELLMSAKREAELANRYKSEFLSNMSHELRTPLTSILLLARVLGENRSGSLGPEQVRHADAIHRAGQDLLGLINEVLDLAKIEAGRMEVRPEVVPIERVIEATRRTFEPLAQQRGLALRVEALADAPPTLYTDGQRLLQILRNLLANALKFTERGEVRLVVSAAPGDQVSFAVSDTGIGIPREQQAAIFEPFRQAETGDTRRYGGTGLGLSISRQLARLLGGELSLRSEVGAGSTFTLTVPRELSVAERGPPPRRPTPRPRATPPAGPRPAGERRILVVEDDRGFAEVLAAIVRDVGFEPVLAATADEAIQRAVDLLPAGVLLDIGLPDASGLVVLEELKRRPETRHLPIHVISAVEDPHAALELGAVGVATKPLDRDEVVAAIHRIEDQLRQRVRHVLLVEDDPILREATTALLSLRDVEVTPAGTVHDALARLAERSWDVVVLDLSLPDGSGYDVLERLAHGSEHGFPPVVVYTGRPLTRDEEDRLRHYTQSVVVKGARSPERLLDEVTLFLHQAEAKLPPDRQVMLRRARERQAPFEHRRVLVVDDDARNVSALRVVFEERGAEVEVAHDGREAVERLRREPPVDLVLMDIMMPGMDGYAAMREVRKDPRHRRLPILALTARAMPEDKQRCLEAGANDYLAKPVDLDRLLALARIWIRR